MTRRKLLSGIYALVLVSGVFAVHVPKIMPSMEISVSAAETLTYEDFEYEISGENVVITKYTGTDIAVVIPERIDDMPVTRIGDTCFMYNYSLYSVELPDTITSIGGQAFRDCKQLAKINFPEGLETIEGWAFGRCSSLDEVKLPSIGDIAFSGCPIKEIELLEQLIVINYNTFADCTKLESIVIPKNVKKIREGAFQGCTALTSVTLPDGLEFLDSGFNDCTQNEPLHYYVFKSIPHF